ncbi:MAG: hypothetical protein BJ554DRAFT_6130 [Olpidium bornovanus]|uniref:Uncharacterized protein n=1 Tax=Olpidium bornovanus TaxID=278681 RepID=A0A8H8A1U4_9FUNG|nr:MAG: hypothetical protein BJ554DRAFT_6130 [Olpidium bornovanus]
MLSAIVEQGKTRVCRSGDIRPRSEEWKCPRDGELSCGRHGSKQALQPGHLLRRGLRQGRQGRELRLSRFYGPRQNEGPGDSPGRGLLRLRSATVHGRSDQFSAGPRGPCRKDSLRDLRLYRQMKPCPPLPPRGAPSFFTFLPFDAVENPAFASVLPRNFAKF